MTELRISKNIVKHNQAIEKNTFNDILVTHSATACMINSLIEGPKMASCGNQADPLILGERSMQRDAGVGQSANYLTGNASEPIDGIVKQNTYSMFDQSSFDKQPTFIQKATLANRNSSKKSPLNLGGQSSENQSASPPKPMQI